MTSSCKLQTDITVHHILILFSTFISYDLNIFTVPGTSFTHYLCKDVKQCCHLCSFITPISHTSHKGFLQHWLLSLSALHQTTKLTAHLAWLMSTALICFNLHLHNVNLHEFWEHRKLVKVTDRTSLHSIIVYKELV